MTTAETTRATDSSNQSGNAGRIIIIVVLVLVGCGVLWLIIRAMTAEPVEDIHTRYGKRHGFEATDSVNGTNVLAEMFEQRGHKVITWRKLSPKLNKVDTIVWFPDDTQPPTKEQRQWLEQWLSEKYNRTLIYVGRDFDAEILYWEKVLPNAPAEEKTKIKDRLSQAKLVHGLMRSGLPVDEDAEWFTVRSNATRKTVTSFDGPWAWESGLDPKSTWIEVQGYLDEPQAQMYDCEVLLDSDAGPLVIKVQDPFGYQWSNGKIIVVSNGSFLLNLPLVNHEHRKFAGLLIDECEGGSVAFLESGVGEPLKIRDSDFQSQDQSWYAMLTVWPLNAVVLHIAAAGIVICFAAFPIFGRPQTTVVEDASDFGKHIDALGALLAKTQDTEYALARLAYYEDKIKRESGASHAE